MDRYAYIPHYYHHHNYEHLTQMPLSLLQDLVLNARRRGNIKLRKEKKKYYYWGNTTNI